MARSAASKARRTRQRQIQRQRRRETAVLEAIREADREAERRCAEEQRREAYEETLAPAVMRQAIYAGEKRQPPRRVPDGPWGAYIWVDGEVITKAQMIVGPRVRILDGKPVRALAVGAHNPAAALTLSPRQRHAATRLLVDWREVGAGLGLGAVDYMSAGGGGDHYLRAVGAHDSMAAQIVMRERLDGAVRYLGPFGRPIARVILDGIPVRVWQEEENARRSALNARARDRVGGWMEIIPELRDGDAVIIAGLTRLADFYSPPEDRVTREPLLSFGPTRSSYELPTTPRCDPP